MPDEIVILSGDASEEAPQNVPTTNENDVQVAQAQADAAVAQAAIMAEAQVKQAEITADATAKEAEYVEKSHFDATINELKEMFASWQQSSQAQPQNEITLISPETSSSLAPETKTEESEKKQEPESKAKHNGSGLRRPFAPGAKKRS